MVRRGSGEARHYYNIRLTRDLFGAWILVREWGVHSRSGDADKQAFVRYRDAAKEANRLYANKRAVGYHPTAPRPQMH